MEKSFRTAAAIFLSIAFATFPSCGCSDNSEDSEEKVEYSPCAYGFVADTLECVHGEIAPGATFGNIICGFGLSSVECNSLLTSTKDIFNPGRLIAGKEYEVWKSPLTDSLKYFVYHGETMRSIVMKCTPPYCAWYSEKEVIHEKKYTDIVVHSSLWNDIQNAGASPLLAVEMDDIFQWTVDFFGLQDGDRFRILYSQSVCEGRVVSIDTVFSACATHAGKDIEAYYYPVSNTSNKYWDENGASLKKAFLKVPLKFSRISSGFNPARRHPITHRVQPHLAVDFAAPSGTPVHSIGDGTVISAGYSGAGGNMVKIKHNNRYSSAYLHLRSFAKGIRAGARVSQGQTIGYVGSTGRSTGPHLDFRIWDGGKAVNPLKIVSPPSEPMKAEDFENFKRIVPLRREELRSYSQQPSL